MKTATPFVMTTAIPIRTAGYLNRRGFIQKAAIIAEENKTLLAMLTMTTRVVLQSESISPRVSLSSRGVRYAKSQIDIVILQNSLIDIDIGVDISKISLSISISIFS